MGKKISQLCSGGIARRRPPVNLKPADSWLFNFEWEIPPTYSLELKDVQISPSGILSRHATALAESFAVPEQRIAWMGFKSRLKFLLRDYLFKRSGIFAGDAYWITDNWSSEYFHWLTDALPRLFLIRGIIGDDGRLLLPYKYQNIEYVQSSPTFFGLSNIEYLDSREVLKVRRLLMPSHLALSGNYNETVMKEMRAFFNKSSLSQNACDNRIDKIYISRRNAPRRKVLNEDEIIPILEDLGFQILCFEEYSFVEQLAIASNARYLVSNHGAGPTNMLFMAPGSRVLELRRDLDEHNNCYFSLASALDLDYYYGLCASADAADSTYIADLIVNKSTFRKTVEALLTA